ncbi:MAG: AIPR family protein [Azospirillaceae bacterium]|nr:AIPR family protein [Azospirillaceae bacterium]
MELVDFLRQTQTEVRTEIADRMGDTGDAYPYPESVFAEIVMQHMAEIGMTFEPKVCHFEATVGRAKLRLSGYAISEDCDQVDLFVSLYEGVDEITPVPDSETKTAASQCVAFVNGCAGGQLSKKIDLSNDVYPLVINIQDGYNLIDQIRIYVLTDCRAKSKNFAVRLVQGKTIKLEVMDIERLHRHWSEGKPRDELTVDFTQVSGGALPCVYVPGETSDYDYALTVIPGEALRFIYEKYGARLLEANVRSFLSVTGKVNRGIRDTLRTAPDRFMAYNNGIVLVADELFLGRTADGSPGIQWMRGMQIVNGGQTTASLYFSKKKDSSIDLSQVRVPAKIIVLRSADSVQEEALISDISRFANSQNAVKLSDLSANKPFHVELEKLALTTYCPDGVGRWFYERAAGSYNTMLARDGSTPAKLKQLKDAIPTSRKITKTDLAKYMNTWDQKPHDVSFGSQKNFERFMEALTPPEGQDAPPLPDVATWKRMVAKAILFKETQKIVRPLVPAFQANVTVYTVALIANRLGSRIDLDRIWNSQAISGEMKQLIRTWAEEINRVLLSSADGRMVSEWAKKAECWQAVLAASYSHPIGGSPEMR